MQSKKETIDQYFKPFENINDLVKAIIIVDKIYSPKKQNFEQIQQCLYGLLAIDLTVSVIKAFIDKVTIYRSYYPLQIISELDKFQDELFNYSLEKQLQSIVLFSPADKCYFCPISTKDWFKYNSPKYSKNSLLYSIDKIRNKIFFLKFFIIIFFIYY